MRARWFAVSLILVIAVGVFGAGMASAGLDQLTSIPVDQAPLIDGVASEAFWADAPALLVETLGEGKWGAHNNSETTVEVKSVYTDTDVYFLFSWADPTYSIDRQRWIFDGQTWKAQDKPPLSQGGAHTMYEDKFAVMWDMSFPAVQDEGWIAAYHEDTEYGRPVKATTKPGELMDMWHFKLVRTNFTTPSQVDDQYVDNVMDPKQNKNAGRHGDPQDANSPGGYFSNEQVVTVDGKEIKVPKYMFKDAANNGYIMTQDMIDRGEVVEISSDQLFDFPVGTQIPGIISKPFTGPRADIAGKATWHDGVYTLEMGRKLDTGDPDHDVIFADLTIPYIFGVATFDNTQIGHAPSDILQFVFGSK